MPRTASCTWLPWVTPIYDGRDTGRLVSLTNDDAALIIVTGCASGPVFVDIRYGPAQPSAPSSWEVQESVSLLITEPLYLSSPLWTEVPGPVLVPDPAGPTVFGSAPGAAGPTST